MVPSTCHICTYFYTIQPWLTVIACKSTGHSVHTNVQRLSTTYFYVSTHKLCWYIYILHYITYYTRIDSLWKILCTPEFTIEIFSCHLFVVFQYTHNYYLLFQFYKIYFLKLDIIIKYNNCINCGVYGSTNLYTVQQLFSNRKLFSIVEYCVGLG